MGDWDHADQMDAEHWDDDWDAPVITQQQAKEVKDTTGWDTDDWIEDTCPKCGADLILPTGRKDARALILADAPFDSDYNASAPLTGPLGSLLETELIFQKLRMRDMRRATLWLHKPNGSKDCLEYCAQRIIQEASQRQVVLLVGAETVRFFTGLGVDAVSSLVVKSQYLPTQVLVACPSPKTVFSSSVGEIRLALLRFKQELERAKNER